MQLPALRRGGSPLARTITALTGYLRPRPDTTLEEILRDAFDRFDRDLGIEPLTCGDRPPAASVPAAEQAGAQRGGWDRRGG